jgi:hypothetical protein
LEISSKEKKLFVDELRNEWKHMWCSKIEDKVRAEGIADKTYERLFVDRGLILFASRNFSPPEFHEILSKYLSSDEAERFNPNPIRGGVRKFIREHITVQKKSGSKLKEETRVALEEMKSHQQLKHGGRGWLHQTMDEACKKRS